MAAGTSWTLQLTPMPTPAHMGEPAWEEKDAPEPDPVSGNESTLPPRWRRSQSPARGRSWMPGSYWDTWIPPALMKERSPLELKAAEKSPLSTLMPAGRRVSPPSPSPSPAPLKGALLHGVFVFIFSAFIAFV